MASSQLFQKFNFFSQGVSDLPRGEEVSQSFSHRAKKTSTARRGGSPEVNFGGRVLLSTLMLGILCGCDVGPVEPLEDENQVGNKLEQISEVSYPDGGDRIAFFDSTVKKIHVFAMNDLKHLYVISPQAAEKTHFIFQAPNGKFTFDFFERNLSVYGPTGQLQGQTIIFPGTPKSAAYLPEKGYLAVMDDAKNLALFQLGDEGQILKQGIFGSFIEGEASYQSGDFSLNGDLVLSGTDGKIFMVPVAKALADPNIKLKDVVTSFSLTDLLGGGDGKVTWLSPQVAKDPENVNLIYLKSGQSLALVDLVKQSLVDKREIPKEETLLKYSKLTQGHVLTGSSPGSSVLFPRQFFKTVEIYYVKDDKIEKRSYVQNVADVTSSFLDQQADIFNLAFVSPETPVNRNHWYESEEKQIDGNKAPGKPKKGRKLVSLRFSDSKSSQLFKIDDGSDFKNRRTSGFQLIPSDLGRVKKLNFQTGVTQELKGFNLPYFGR